MACKLDRPDPQTLFDRIKNNFSTNVLKGGTVIPETNEWYVVSNDYAMAEEFYSISEQQWRARDPQFACCSDLYEIAARDGVTPKPAGFAQGYVRVTGVSGTVTPTTIEITINGNRYRGIGSIPGEIPENGHIDFRVQAVVPGPLGNDLGGATTGTFANAPNGIDETVQVHGDYFCGGAEVEACEAFRARYLERKAYKPRATYAWLVEKIKEWPCVTRVAYRGGACCEYTQQSGPDCGCNTCTNKLEFYPLFDSTFDCGIPPQCVIDDMNNWLFGVPAGRGLGQVDIGICGKLYAPLSARAVVRLSGLSCATSNQITLIKTRIREIFRRAVPGEILTARSIEAAIAQIVGSIDDLGVTFTIKNVGNGGMTYTSCGDLNPACDVLPCLANIIVVNTFTEVNVC